MGKYYKHPDAQGKVWLNNFVKIEELFEGYIIEFREKKWFVADMNQLVMDLQECLLDPNSVGEAIWPLTNDNINPDKMEHLEKGADVGIGAIK